MSAPAGKLFDKVLAKAGQLDRYDVGETIESLAAKLGKKPSEILKLNSNENFFVPLDFLRSLLREVVEEADPRIYPRDELKELKSGLGRYLKVSPEMIVLGTGSDQLIDLVARMILRDGDEALSISPTFSIYERCTRVQGATYRAVLLKKDFSLDVDRMLASVTPETKLLFLCSPNNPTGNQFEREKVRLLAESFDGFVAVDEAYADFAKGSIVDLAGKLENLIIFRTFSKVFGLAGLRLGCAVADPKLIEIADERYQMPYSVTLVSVKAALKILEKTEVIRQVVEEVKAERGRFVERLNRVDGVRAFDSETNFVLFKVGKSSARVYRELLKKGVIIRDIGRVLHLDNCLRVTVAPSPMTERFLAALTEVLGEDAE